MKFLWFAVCMLALLVTSPVIAESRLPQCPSDIKVLWTNCEGTLTMPNGDKYVGEFLDHKPNGQGTITWTNGTKYVGEVSDGKMNGKGTITWPDGRVDVGEFRDGKIDAVQAKASVSPARTQARSMGKRK